MRARGRHTVVSSPFSCCRQLSHVRAPKGAPPTGSYCARQGNACPCRVGACHPSLRARGNTGRGSTQHAHMRTSPTRHVIRKCADKNFSALCHRLVLLPLQKLHDIPCHNCCRQFTDGSVAPLFLPSRYGSVEYFKCLNACSSRPKQSPLIPNRQVTKLNLSLGRQQLSPITHCKHRAN